MMMIGDDDRVRRRRGKKSTEMMKHIDAVLCCVLSCVLHLNDAGDALHGCVRER